MATVVDALIVTLGLDPTQFNKGQKDAANAFLKTRQEAEKSGKIIEDSAKKTADAISKVTREVLTLYATFLGARGLKEFIAQLDSADASLGRFSANLGQSPQTIAAWGMAAERMGGSAEATAGSFERIGKALYDLHRNGQLLPKEFSQLQALTGRRIDTEHGVDKFLRDTAAALKAMNAIDPTQAHFLAQGMGIDDATANVMIKYGDAIGAYLDQIKKLSPSNDAIKAAQQLQDQWVTLQQAAVSLANAVLEKLGPTLAKLLGQMTDWLEKNQDWLKSGIVDGVGKFADYLQKVDWNAIGQGLKDFGNDAKHVADAIGGITTATEVLFALWAGSKALGMLGSLRTVLGGSAASAAGGSASSGILGKLGVAAAGIGLAIWGAEKYKERSAAGLVETPEQQERIKKFNQMRAGNRAWMQSGSMKNSSGSPDDRDSGYYQRTKSLDDLLTNTTPRVVPKDASGHADALQNNPALGAPMLGNGRDAALDAFLNGDTKIDGRPVSKSNPMPVTLQQQGSGGGFWESVGNFFGGLLGGSGTSSAPSGQTKRSSSLDVDDSGIPNGNPSSKITGSAKRLMDRLVTKHGWTPAAAAIAAGNAYAESGFRSGIMGDPQVPGGSWGLFQWNRGRLARLKQFAKLRGADWKDPDIQTDYFAMEADEMIPNWKKQTDLSNADAIGKRFEGYRGPIQRARSAQAAKFLQGYQPPLSVTNKGYADSVMSGAKDAALSNIQTNHTSTTSSTSNAFHIERIEVNAPQATDAKGIANSITDSLFRSTVAATANSGPQ